MIGKIRLSCIDEDIIKGVGSVYFSIDGVGVYKTVFYRFDDKHGNYIYRWNSKLYDEWEYHCFIMEIALRVFKDTGIDKIVIENMKIAEENEFSIERFNDININFLKNIENNNKRHMRSLETLQSILNDINDRRRV